MWIHSALCTLSKLDRQLRAKPQAADDVKFASDRAAAEHFFDMAAHEVELCFRELSDNTDDTMLTAAAAAMKYAQTLPNDRYVIHEASPNAKGTGHTPANDAVKQFTGDGQAPPSFEHDAVHADNGESSGGGNSEVNGAGNGTARLQTPGPGQTQVSAGSLR